MINKSFGFLLVFVSVSTFSEGGMSPQDILLMSPKNVKEMRSRVNDREQALYEDISETNSSGLEYVDITLEPGEPLRSVNIKQRSPSSLLFVDATGTPWPIVDLKAFDGDLFGAEKVNNKFKNSLTLFGQLPAGSSFLQVFLAGLQAPITIKVVVGDAVYHGNTTFRVGKIGPETHVTSRSLSAAKEVGLPADSDLNNVLYDVGPPGARKMISSHSTISAWKVGSDVLVRSNIHVFSPEPKRIKPGQNGYTAYRFPDTTRLNASTPHGDVVKVILEEQ